MRFILDMTIANSIVVERVQLQTLSQVDRLIEALEGAKKYLWPYASDNEPVPGKQK